MQVATPGGRYSSRPTVSSASTNAGGSSQGADRTFTTPPEAPTVTSLSPAIGAQAGADTVIISGTTLAGASAVRFGTSDARSFSVDSPSSITAVTPAGTGTVDVFVTTPGGTSAASAADRFTYEPAPKVTKLAPRSGPVGGGVTVSVTGANLAAACNVTFGSAAAPGFDVRSAGSIVAIAPREAAGTVDVRVTTPGGTSAVSAADRFAFTPLITGLNPPVGTTAGGTVVAVTGEGFVAGNKGMTIKFGTIAAASVECPSATSCNAVSPAHAAGTVQVKAIVSGRTSPKAAGTSFTYQ